MDGKINGRGLRRFSLDPDIALADGRRVPEGFPGAMVVAIEDQAHVEPPGREERAASCEQVDDGFPCSGDVGSGSTLTLLSVGIGSSRYQ